MRVQRFKKARRLLRLLKIVHGFFTPFRVLVDGTFLFQSAALHTDTLTAMRHMLQDEPSEFFVTACVLGELAALGEAGRAALALAKSFRVTRCDHAKAPIAPNECLRSVVGANSEHWFVASVDRELLTELRKVPGVPLFTLNRNVTVLEPPSSASRALAHEVRRARVSHVAGRGAQARGAAREFARVCQVHGGGGCAQDGHEAQASWPVGPQPAVGEAAARGAQARGRARQEEPSPRA
jgi:rRNA-processing protein FCF1